MRGWFWFAISAVAGGGTGGFPSEGGCGAEVGTDEDRTDGDAVPLGFLVDGSCAGNLLVEDIEEVCVGCEEQLEVLVLGGSIGAGCFPFDMGGVGI